MGLRNWFLARTYERRMRGLEEAGLSAMRRQLLSMARGDVLEVGAGAGVNLTHYPTSIRSVTASEPGSTMLRQLTQAAAQLGNKVTVVQAAADALPFADASFDTVVSTLVLCGVEDQEAAMQEMRRVLKPDGVLLVLEHVRADSAELAEQQDRYNRLNRFFTGCNCNRSTRRTLQQCGFTVEGVRVTEIPGAPALVRPAIIGAAYPAPS